MRHVIITWVLAVATVAGSLQAFGCARVTIGAPFQIDPHKELKIGHDRKSDVLRKMGQPYRSFVDSLGHEVFTYVWADGQGTGKKCVIAFNQNEVVYLVETVP